MQASVHGLAEVRAAEVGMVEVVFAWRDEAGQRQVLDIEQLDSKRAGSLWIGANGRFVLPLASSASRDGEERFCLVRREGQEFVLALPPGATCSLNEHAGSPLRRHVLREGELIEVRLERFSFFVRPSAGVRSSIDRGAFFEPSSLRWIAAVFGLHAVFLGLSFFAPPNASALQLDLLESDARFISAHLAAIEVTPELTDDHFGSAPRDREASTAAVTSSVSVSGGRGHEGAAQRGARRTEVPLTPEQVETSGLLHQLSHWLAHIMGDE